MTYKIIEVKPGDYRMRWTHTPTYSAPTKKAKYRLPFYDPPKYET